MSEPLDDACLHDPAVLAWKQYHTLMNNGAPAVEVDMAFSRYMQAVSEQMKIKEGHGDSQ